MTEQFNTPDSILARLERLQASGKTALRPSPLSSEMILARLSGKGINVSDITASEKSGHPFHGNQWTNINYETHVTDQSDAVWNALQHGKEGISGIGCQSGGCLMVAKALQNNIGGNLKTISVVYNDGKESDAHAIVEKEGQFIDSKGIQSEDEVKTYWKSWLNAKEIKIKDYKKGDFPYTPYNEEAVAKLTKTLRLKFSKQINADKSTITASDVRREILRRKIEVIRAAAKDVSKEHRDANGKWASNPAGEPKGKIKHAVLIIDGKRYKGASHMSALMDWGTKNHKEGLPKVPERHQGFETESGHYLDREEAAEYGLKNNLVKEDADEAENTGKLRSEMLHLKATDGKLYVVETVFATGDVVGHEFHGNQWTNRVNINDPQERKSKISQRDELKEQGQSLAEKEKLTSEEAEKFRDINSKLNSLRYDLQRPLPIEKIASEQERRSSLSAKTVQIAHAELFRDKDIHSAITDAAVGVYHNSMTLIDKIVSGKNPKISPEKFYNNFEKTRQALREQYGDNLTLYRAVGLQMDKPTTNWATTKEYAKQFGDKVISKSIPVKNVIAVNVGGGKYHELIVGEPPTSKSEGITAAEARTAEQDLAPELREHNRIRDEAEAPYRHAMARLIAAAELAKLKEKKAASKKKKEQEEAALIALWLLLMQDASQEAYATAGNALGGLLTVQPPSIPLTDAETPQIEPQNEIPPVTTEEASSYFERRKPLIQEIPNRVMERLDKAIDAGRSLGEDDRLLRLRLKREAQAIQSGYGEMVARNEAQATYTGAQIATLRKAGFATKIWVTMDDDRVRESHIDCGQQGEVLLDKPFMNGLMYPCEPDAPPEETCNCRCWLIGGRRIGEAVQATEKQQPDSKVMSKGSLSVGRGEKLPISKGAGLTAKGRAKYNRAHGSNLKAPAPHPKTEKDAARRRSFCARMKGVVKHAKGDAPRAKASLKRWNCH